MPGMPAGRLKEIAICGAFFAARPPAYVKYAYGRHGSNCIHISSISFKRPATASVAVFFIQPGPAWLYARGAGFHRLPNAGPIG